MNVNKVLTKGYENKRLFRCAENKPNLSRRSLWRSRIKPNLKAKPYCINAALLPEGRSLLPEGSLKPVFAQKKGEAMDKWGDLFPLFLAKSCCYNPLRFSAQPSLTGRLVTSLNTEI
jgi:hypothetical protein